MEDVTDERSPGRGARLFQRLGERIVRHPWHFVFAWVVLLVICVPFLPLLASVTTNSTTTLPSSAPSSIAAAELARLFPNESSGSSAYLLFTATNMTSAHAQGVVQAVTAALLADHSLEAVASITSVYVLYSEFLGRQAIIGSQAIQNARNATPSLPASMNQTAAIVWASPGYFLVQWQRLVANGTAPATASPEAYRAGESEFQNDPAGLAELSAFYSGYAGSGEGFNGTADCAAHPSAVVACAQGAVRSNQPPPPDPLRTAAATDLGFGNWTAWSSVRFACAALLSPGVGLPAGWLVTLWTAFPSSVPDPALAQSWASAVVSHATLASEPLPVPLAMTAQYVAPAGTAQVIIVAFSEGDSGSGGNPVFSDVSAINVAVPPIVRAHDPGGSIVFIQTGPAALDQATQTILNGALGLVLPLTVIVLIAITAIYFRSPITPLVAFVGLAIALILGLGGTVLLGNLVTHVDTTALTLEEVFVLGVGTDYSIFLIARYREELVRGRSSKEAVVASVSWAGQSVATSGAAAVIATLALAFSGLALLSQWGMVLSLAIFITVLLSLTIVPALLTILGPRIFWPITRERFVRQSARNRSRTEREATYFYRVGRSTQRHPARTLALVLILSAPILVAAISVPISYDYYQQLPPGNAAALGLAQLGQHYGGGFAFPTTALVTFASPLLVGTTPNTTEFADIANLSAIAEATAGISVVESMVGPYGAPLAEWLGIADAPPATQQILENLQGAYVGSDGRTVLFALETGASGLSVGAISTLRSIESSFSGYADRHASLTSLAYAGGAPTTGDLAAQTAQATERMILAVAIGLLVVLFAVLRSWIIPIMAVATIGLSIGWAWGITYLVLGGLLGLPIFFFVPTLLFILILGLGIDYNIFLLTRVREERLRGRSSGDAAVEAVGRTGGIISAAAIILAGAFATLLIGQFTLLIAIGFSVAVAVVLDAMVVRTFLVPALLHLLGDRVWRLPGRRRTGPAEAPASSPTGETVKP